MKSRRDFLKLTGVLSSALILPTLDWGTLLAKTSAFPRRDLFFEPSELPLIRKKLELPLFKSYWKELLQADVRGDEKFLKKEIQFNNQIHHLIRADKIPYDR
jgi:hypothetical protein